jgi:hypothetical protein
MLSAAELAHRLSDFAMGLGTVRDFENWLVHASWNAHDWAPADVRDAVYSIELALAEYSNGHRSNSYLRAVAGDIARELDSRLNNIRPTRIASQIATSDLLRHALPANPLAAAA